MATDHHPTMNNSSYPSTKSIIGGGSSSNTGSVTAAAAMASYSPISTLDRQYRVGSVGDGSSARLLLAVHCNAACCVTLQETWKVQNNSDGYNSSYASSQQQPELFNDAASTSDTASVATTAASTQDNSSMATSTISSDDPFSFLNCAPSSSSAAVVETSTTSTQPPSPASRKKNNFGMFLKKVAATSTKAIERGMHHLAVKADQGRTPDYLIVGLFDERTDTLLSATEAQRLPEEKAPGVRFHVPLVVPAAAYMTGGSIVVRLWVRSGAALAASKHYLVAESGPLDVAKLRLAIMGQAAHSSPQAAQQLPLPGALSFPVPLHSAVVLDGLLQCTVVPDQKFTTIAARGWSLQDPEPRTAYRNDNATMFHLPLDQSYAFVLPATVATSSSPLLLATERTVESTVVLPLAAAVAQLAATASRVSLTHLEAVSKAVYDYRHDAAEGEEYAQCTLRVSHLQSNMASSSLLQSASSGSSTKGGAVGAPVVSAMLQRPNSIFEVEVMTPARLPLHPSAAGGLRHDVSGTFYPKPVRHGILPSILQQLPSGRLDTAHTPGFLLGTVRMQVTVPRRKSDGTGGGTAATVAENPFDPVGNAPLPEETWECLIPLEQFLTNTSGKPGETKSYAVYSVTGQNMGSLYVSINVQMMQQPKEAFSPSSNPSAAGGLVSLMGLQNLMDCILPALDFDETTLGGAGSGDVPASNVNPEQQRRRSQIATMGLFVTHAYLEEHLNFVRVLDCQLLEERALQYKQALAAAGTASATKETVPSYKDRTPRAFRPSASRTTVSLTGIGFNVHTGTLSLDVIEASPTDGTLQKTDGAVFCNITSGAPADHARGFGNIFASKDKSNPAAPSASAAATVNLKSPIGPVNGGLRRLEAARKSMADEVSNQQTILVMYIANYFVERRNAISAATTAGSGVRPVTHVPAGNVALQGMRWKIFEAVQCLHHLTWTCAVRRAGVFSQALGIAVSSYLSSISDSSKTQSTWPEIWTRHGFLVSYEGLLSAAGKELGMIEDASVGIDMLRMVSIILVPDDGIASNPARIPVPHSTYIRWIHLWTAPRQTANGTEIDYFLQIGLVPSYFEQRVPMALRNGTPVRFYPILFEVGVDIFQAASNLGSNMSRSVTSTGNCEPDAPQQEVLSDDDEDTVGAMNDDVLVQLNYEAFQKMNAYAQAVSPAPPVQATQTHQTHPLLATLFQHIASSAGKMNHSILVEASHLVSTLGGGACVFCKSGKDRTAMHVTYKQAQFASRFRQRKMEQPNVAATTPGGSPADTTLEDAMLFRLHGTRLPICEKNVGQAKYAFNSLQTKFMPDALKPPPSALAGFLKGGKVFGGGGIES